MHYFSILVCGVFAPVVCFAFQVREHNDEPLIPIQPKGLPITPRDDDGERIVGGSDASPGEFPFIVSFQELTRTWRRAFCGGTIYDESTVITAAHCINQNDLGKLYVVGGEHSLESTSGTEQKLKVKKMITHYGYNSRTLNNDIAILQLDGKFDFSGKYVKSIPTCKGDYSVLLFKIKKCQIIYEIIYEKEAEFELIKLHF